MNLSFFAIVLLVCCIASVQSVDPNVTAWKDCGTCQIARVMNPTPTSYLIQTTDGRMHRSIDEGKTWELMFLFVNDFVAYDAAPTTIIFLLNRNQMYRSIDGGVTKVQCTTPTIDAGNTIEDITLHPNNVGTFLVLSCTTSNPKTCKVLYTQDFCNTWQTGPSSMAYARVAWSPHPGMPSTIFGINSAGVFGSTDDFGHTWKPLYSSAIGFIMTDHFLYVGVFASYNSAKLYSSSARIDATHQQKNLYRLAEFPNGNTLEQGYTFLDDSTRSEFIGVTQPVSGSNRYGAVYASDFDGAQFAMTLNYVAEDSTSPYFDFDKFNGLPGIYLANSYSSAAADSTTLQTKFSFDNGGEWHLLTAPTVDYNGNPTNCKISDGCGLHLYGMLSWLRGAQPPYYSSPNAIGLMVAVGNIGKYLSADHSKAKTYFTRDAGITWTEIFEKPTIYEFGDHGGILVFATTDAPTNRVYYSLNEGKSVKSFVFTNTPITVDNIITEPTGTGRQFVLIGNVNDTTYYVFHLDFTTLNIPKCTDSDYEDWSPSNDDFVNSNCFMGETTYFTRRKQDSECYNDRDTDHMVNQTACLCDWEDYECDVGFDPSARNMTDYFTCTANTARPGCATGYRKIPDTQCQGGLDLEAKNCPGYSGSPTTGDDSTTGTGSTTGTTGSTTGSATSSTGPTTVPTPVPTPTPPTSSTSAGVTTTGGGGGEDKKKKGSSAGVTATVVIFVLIFGTAAVAGVLYWKNDSFRELVQEKLFNRNRGDQGYGVVNQNEDDI